MAKVKLNDVAVEARETWKQNKTDVPVVGLEHLEPDEIWLRRWDLNPDENTFTKGFRKGQLLFGRRRAYQKKMSVASCDGICSGDITVIAARPEKILPELLPFYLRTDSFFDFAVRGSGGSLSPRVKWSHISDYEFDLPPIEEQKKLAELLWAANDLKEMYKKAITATDEMLKAKFREMFGNPVQESIHTLDEMIYDLRYGISQPPQFDELGTYKFIRATNIEKGKIVEKDMLKIADSEQERVAKCRLKGREVIIVRSGANAGDSSYIPESYAGSFAGYDIIVCIDESKADPQYIAFVLAMPEYFRSKIKPMTARTAEPHINTEQVRSLSMPFPPLSLQREFVAIAEKAESAKTALKKSIADIDQVMKGLING